MRKAVSNMEKVLDAVDMCQRITSLDEWYKAKRKDYFTRTCRGRFFTQTELEMCSLVRTIERLVLQPPHDQNVLKLIKAIDLTVAEGS